MTWGVVLGVWFLLSQGLNWFRAAWRPGGFFSVGPDPGELFGYAVVALVMAGAVVIWRVRRDVYS